MLHFNPRREHRRLGSSRLYPCDDRNNLSVYPSYTKKTITSPLPTAELKEEQTKWADFRTIVAADRAFKKYHNVVI